MSSAETREEYAAVLPWPPLETDSSQITPLTPRRMLATWLGTTTGVVLGTEFGVLGTKLATGFNRMSFETQLEVSATVAAFATGAIISAIHCHNERRREVLEEAI